MSKTSPIWYELRNAVAARNFGAADSLLKSNASLITDTNSIGETVLHYLAIENDIEGVSFLHRRGFNLNTRNEFGTPLFFEVAQLNYRDLLKWLFDHGIDMKSTDSYGQSVQEYLADFGKQDVSLFLASMITEQGAAANP
jgi:ankyrin repeat protein